MIVNGIEELFIARDYGQYKEITEINLNKIIIDPHFVNVCGYLPQFTNVVKLSICENDFSAIEDCVERWKLLWKTIRSMQKLKILHFCNNILVEFNLEEWEDLKLSIQLMQLEEIDLSNNNLGYFGNNNLHIWKIIWESIASCEKLTKLLLRGNNIDKISISAFKIIKSVISEKLNLLQVIELFDNTEELDEEHQIMLHNVLANVFTQIEPSKSELKLSFSL